MALAERLQNLFTLRNKKIWQKLALIAAPFLLPIAVLAYYVISATTTQIDSARKEKVGAEYIHTVRKLVQYLQQHRGMSSTYLSGDASFRSRIASKGEQIAQELAALDELDRKYGNTIKSTARWQIARKHWLDLVEKNLTLQPAESFDLHTEVIFDLFAVVQDVAEFSTLGLDQENASFYLQDGMIARELILTEFLGQSRAKGGATLARIAKSREQAAKAEGKQPEAVTVAATNDERVALLIRLGSAQRSRNDLADCYSRAFRANPALKAKLEETLQEHLTAADQCIAFAETKIVKAENVTVPAAEWFDLSTRTIDTGFKLYDASEPELIQMLDTRITNLRWTLGYVVTAIAVGIVVVLLVAWLVARSILGQVGSITNLFSQIGMGNFAARAEVTSQDELGEMANALNAMLDNTLALMQSREEKEQIQESIGKLLEEVSVLADGDLTKDAEVTADITGAIADAFNHVSAQLRKIISNVQQATTQVSTAATQIQTTTSQLAAGSQAQSTQIVTVSAAIDEMAVSIQQVSDNAVQSATVAQQALSNAKKGNESVQNTIEGMNRIRDQVQETAKRIKRLGESSQEIGQIIQLIDDIADRTSILALNASIQAAMAGEAGRGFAVVAEEVERLAARSTDATKKIGTLVKTIQGETTEAVAAMERSINEVVEGSGLANQAGQALGEIQAVSSRLAELIQSISLAAKQQARASEGVAKSMGEISQVTQDTAAGNEQAATAVNDMAVLVDDLRESVSQFRLPEGVGATRYPDRAADHGRDAKKARARGVSRDSEVTSV